MEKIENGDKFNKANIRRPERQEVSARIFLAVLMLFLVTGCSQYKSSWSCRNPEGIGCSSISYADRIARKNIILNDDVDAEQGPEVNQQSNHNNKREQRHKKLLIRERYSDFKKQSQVEVDFD